MVPSEPNVQRGLHLPCEPTAISIPYPADRKMGHNFNKSPETPLCPSWVRTTKPLPVVNEGRLRLEQKILFQDLPVTEPVSRTLQSQPGAHFPSPLQPLSHVGRHGAFLDERAWRNAKSPVWKGSNRLVLKYLC